MSLSKILPLKLNLIIGQHQGSTRTGMESFPFDQRSISPSGSSEGSWSFTREIQNPEASVYHLKLSAKREHQPAQQVAFGLCLQDTEWHRDNYVLIPGAVYGANRFRAHMLSYPPPPLGPGPDQDPQKLEIMDLPRLQADDSVNPSHLDQQSIDAATPGIGIYFPSRKKALLILTPQKTDVGTYGLEIIESSDRSSAQILITSPGIRHEKYFGVPFQKPGGHTQPSEDRSADLETGDSIELDFQLHWFDCENVQGLFDRLFDFRHALFSDGPLRKEISFSATWDILQRVQNTYPIWRGEHGFYQTSILGENTPELAALLFQSGWCGGMISTYPMLQEGDPRSVERSLRSLAFYFTGLSPSGYFYPYFDGEQWTCDAGRQDPNPKPPWTLTRRNGDVLYFLLRHFMLIRERGRSEDIKPEWEKALRKNADALVSQWERYGDLGQYVDVNTGELTVAGTTSGALVPAALLLASDYFQSPDYLETAKAIADHYRIDDLARGITTGGPGDAVQAPDSESIFQLVESFIMLFEKTGDAKWSEAAHAAVIQGASWALSYDYAFPEGSALHTIQAQSRGAFLANAQNKTAVPGICTLSGQGILRTYRATGDRRLMSFLRETCHSIAQYMGRTDKKIPCKIKAGNPQDDQPEGWICERVNVTQWGEPLGELFAYSTWCSVSMMLVWCDLPGVYAEPDTGYVMDLDHVDAWWVGETAGNKTLHLHNPTAYDARVRILLEDANARRKPLAINAAANWPIVSVKAGETIRIDPTEL